jgi:hypothetical protein
MVPADSDRGGRGLPGIAGQAIGLVTREARRAPLVALSIGLQAWEGSRGLREFALRRGGEALQIVAHTPLGRFLPEPLLEPDVRDEAGRIASSARKATQATEASRAAANQPTRRTTNAAPAAAPSKPPATPAPARPAQPSAEAVAVGAPGVATETAEKVTDQLHLAEPTTREDLPIPDFDNITLGSLRARLRSLSVEQLVVLREWEQAHADRLPVITLLDNRIAKLAAADDDGRTAYPAEGAAGS